MALILNIETSTNVCSASLSEKGVILEILENFDDKSHATSLTVFIENLFKKTKYDFKSIDAVSVSEGPGSYTGLRIGVSVAKGICYALKKPLIAVNTLKTMAIMAKNTQIGITKDILFCPMIDARRMEAYTALFDNDLNYIQKTKAEIVNENTYSKLLDENKVYFFGNGADKFKDIIKHKNAFFIDNIYASAKYMAELSEINFKLNIFENTAYFEPFYLKDFVATQAKNKFNK